MANGVFKIALTDIFAAVARYPVPGMLGWQDIRKRYHRSFIGPFWLTIGMGVMIATIGIVFGMIFQSPKAEFLPFLALGIIFWSFISSVITEGCVSFIAAGSIIRQLSMPLFVHIMRVLWRNSLILAHNIIIFPLVLIVMGERLTWLALLSIAGFLLLLANLLWMALILSVLCTRYRDLSPIVKSILRVVFYLTPIIWMPSLVPERAGDYLKLNPFYHLLDIVRAPLLGQWPDSLSWNVTIIMAVVGWCMALAFYGGYKHRIAYWL